MKHLKLTIGDVFYRVQNRKKFEVTRIDDTGVYLCCFKGNCSEIVHLWNGTTEAEFCDRFAKTHLDAFEKYVVNAESNAKGLREYLAEYKAKESATEK